MAGDTFMDGGNYWKLVKYKGMNGYVMAEFLADVSEEIPNTDYIPEQVDPFQPNTPEYIPQTLEQRVAELERLLSLLMDEVGSKHRGDS